jgi:hypothetical protein
MKIINFILWLRKEKREKRKEKREKRKEKREKSNNLGLDSNRKTVIWTIAQSREGDPIMGYWTN